MPPSFLPATATAELPASMQDANATVGERACAPVTGVGGVRQDTFAALDPDDTFDYFQAQGRLAAEMVVAGRCRIRSDSTNHYLYRLTDEVTGEFYVGVRSCRCAPHEDRRYFGSGRWPRERSWHGQPVRKEVLATFPTRLLAEEAEELLIDMVLLDRRCRNSWTSASAAFKAANPGRCRRGTR